MLRWKECVMSTKSVYIGTDHFFWGGDWAFSKQNSCTAKLLKKNSSKGSHGRKNIKQVLCAIYMYSVGPKFEYKKILAQAIAQ